MKSRSPKVAQAALNDAENLVVEQGNIIQEDRRWDAAEAALDGQPKQYLADIISGKIEGPYEPTSKWVRGRGKRER